MTTPRLEGHAGHVGTFQDARPDAPVRVLSVIGTRPEAIKMAPVIQALEADPGRFVSRVCVTAQHRQMVDQMLDLFGIEPDYDLDVMRPGQSLTDITRAVLAGMDEVLRADRPDWILVQGDTTTVLAASLAGFYHGIRVGHVEAGLRTFDKGDPFPEEVNRRVAGAIADLHFAPTDWAANNLRREAVPDDAIRVTGNTVIDALHQVGDLSFDPQLAGFGDIPDNRRVVLVTTHRKENFGHAIEEICLGLRALSRRYSDELQLVFPVHMNPKVREPVHRYLAPVENVTLLDPVDYQSLVWLLGRCHFLITDSGGLQEEATGVGKPVLVLRDSTERPEGVLAGSAHLIGANADHIVEWGSRLMTDVEGDYDRMAQATSPYGDGSAAGQIVDALHEASLQPVSRAPAEAYDSLLRVASGDAPHEPERPRRFVRPRSARVQV